MCYTDFSNKKVLYKQYLESILISKIFLTKILHQHFLKENIKAKVRHENNGKGLYAFFFLAQND